MEFNEYQTKALETAIYPKEAGLQYTILGLVSEAGEVAGKMKKILRDDGGIVSDEKRRMLMDELSDCFWYCATVAKELGYSMDDVARYNIEKLASRKTRGVIGGSGDKR